MNYKTARKTCPQKCNNCSIKSTDSRFTLLTQIIDQDGWENTWGWQCCKCQSFDVEITTQFITGKEHKINIENMVDLRKLCGLYKGQSEYISRITIEIPDDLSFFPILHLNVDSHHDIVDDYPLHYSFEIVSCKLNNMVVKEILWAPNISSRYTILYDMPEFVNLDHVRKYGI